MGPYRKENTYYSQMFSFEVSCQSMSKSQISNSFEKLLYHLLLVTKMKNPLQYRYAKILSYLIEKEIYNNG